MRILILLLLANIAHAEEIDIFRLAPGQTGSTGGTTLSWTVRQDGAAPISMMDGNGTFTVDEAGVYIIHAQFTAEITPRSDGDTGANVRILTSGGGGNFVEQKIMHSLERDVVQPFLAEFDTTLVFDFAAGDRLRFVAYGSPNTNSVYIDGLDASRLDIAKLR